MYFETSFHLYWDKLSKHSQKLNDNHPVRIYIELHSVNISHIEGKEVKARNFNLAILPDTPKENI